MKEAWRNLILISFVFFVVDEIAQTEEALHNSKQILSYFYQLYRASGYRSFQRECAAWIIQGTDGYILRNWPPYKEKHKQLWNQPVPYGVLAIAHTHAADAKPSSTDVLTAKKIRLPIYVISKWGIWLVQVDGRISQVQKHDWLRLNPDRQLERPMRFNSHFRRAFETPFNLVFEAKP